MTQNILSYALSNDCKIGFSSGTFPGNSYTEELPDEGIKYGTWEITKRSQNTITIKVFSPYKSTMWVNSYVNTAGWNGWKQMVVNTDLQVKRHTVPQPTPGSIFTEFKNWWVRIFKSGKAVTITLNISGSMTANNNTHSLFAIPEEYRPTTDVIINYVTQKGSPMLIDISGDLTQLKLGNMGKAITEDWLCRQCITYVTN